MSDHETTDATAILRAAAAGDGQALHQLMPMLYDQLRAMAGRALRRERQDHTLQPTALVHEAFLRLIDQSNVDWQDRAHFLAFAAETIRRILVDHARKHKADKRGGKYQRVSLDDPFQVDENSGLELLALDDAITRLAKLSERQARVIELRFFGGMSVEETAHAIGVSERTVKDDWRVARAWLNRELSRGGEHGQD